MKSIVFLVFISSFFACNGVTVKKEAANETLPVGPPVIFDKLSGTWKHEDGKNFERWIKNDNGTYRYTAFNLQGKDTSWNEKADIYSENGNWVFENTVKGQNNGKSVKFTSTQLNDTQVQFSNPAHDFPTDIHYTVIDKDTVKAFIFGPNNKGGRDTIPFNYTRVK